MPGAAAVLMGGFWAYEALEPSPSAADLRFGTALAANCDYVHLNPVRARMLNADFLQELAHCRV